MAKQILMDLEEYENEKNSQFSNGFQNGRNQMIQVTTQILKGLAKDVTVDEKAEQVLKDFVEMLKTAENLLPEGALDVKNEQADGKADTGDQELPDESPHKDNV